jgi:hypothetical protein
MRKARKQQIPRRPERGLCRDDSVEAKATEAGGTLDGPALKRTIKSEFFPGALKRSVPRMNAGAPTRRLQSKLRPA